MKKVCAGLAAFALVGALALSAVADVAAVNDVSGIIIDSAGVPEGMSLVATTADGDDWCGGNDEHNSIDCNEMIFGKKGFDLFEQANAEVAEKGYSEEDDEYYVIYAKYIDQLDYFPIAAAAFDIFLEDDNHEKVEDYDGGDITMTLDYDYNPFEDFDSDRYFSRSQAEWEPGILHIKHDWTSEVLPATIDDDGAWTFTTSSLSLFMPAFVRVKSEEAAPVKTADNMMAYVGLVAISLAAFTTFGIYIRKTRR